MIHFDHSLHRVLPGPRPATGLLVQLLWACLCLILVKFQLSDSLNHVLDHDTLVFRSYGLTGVSPRTKVCPDDTIQDRGCYRDEERWRSNDLCVCECSGSSNCGSGDGGMLPSCLTERPEDIRFVFLTLEVSSCWHREMVGEEAPWLGLETENRRPKAYRFRATYDELEWWQKALWFGNKTIF